MSLESIVENVILNTLPPSGLFNKIVTKIVNEAVEGNYLPLEQAKADGHFWTADLCQQAVTINNLTILKWLRQNDCPWSTFVLYCALEDKYYEIAHWLINNNCPADDFIYRKVIQNGDLATLKLLVLPHDEAFAETAVIYKELDILKWLKVNGCPWNKWRCVITAAEGRLGNYYKLIPWIRTHCIDEMDEIWRLWRQDNDSIISWLPNEVIKDTLSWL